MTKRTVPTGASDTLGRPIYVANTTVQAGASADLAGCISADAAVGADPLRPHGLPSDEVCEGVTFADLAPAAVDIMRSYDSAARDFYATEPGTESNTLAGDRMNAAANKMGALDNEMWDTLGAMPLAEWSSDRAETIRVAHNPDSAAAYGNNPPSTPPPPAR